MSSSDCGRSRSANGARRVKRSSRGGIEQVFGHDPVAACSSWVASNRSSLFSSRFRSSESTTRRADAGHLPGQVVELGLDLVAAAPVLGRLATVAVGLAGLGQQDERCGVGGLGREDQVQQDEVGGVEAQARRAEPVPQHPRDDQHGLDEQETWPCPACGRCARRSARTPPGHNAPRTDPRSGAPTGQEPVDGSGTRSAPREAIRAGATLLGFETARAASDPPARPARPVSSLCHTPSVACAATVVSSGLHRGGPYVPA